MPRRDTICCVIVWAWAGFLAFFFFANGPVYAVEPARAQTVKAGEAGGEAREAPDGLESSPEAAGGKPSGEFGDVTEKDLEEKPSDEYGDVTEAGEAGGQGARIADPIEPWNRAMYHFNDKLYFWALKPVAEGYKYVVPENVRGLFASFYLNLTAPVRIVNNLLQGELRFAGIELGRFLINSTVGVGGLRDCAKECFGITGRDADFGQTLGRWGLGTGFYIVWPVIGPSSPRDSVGFVADTLLTPTTYLSLDSSQLINPLTVSLYVHNKVNYTSFHIGDYETLKAAAIDFYVAMRDAYAQNRKKAVESVK